MAKNVEVGTNDAAVVNFTMIPKMEDELEATLGHVNKVTNHVPKKIFLC